MEWHECSYGGRLSDLSAVKLMNEESNSFRKKQDNEIERC